jgi:hypothetical protein
MLTHIYAHARCALPHSFVSKILIISSHIQPPNKNKLLVENYITKFPESVETHDYYWLLDKISPPSKTMVGCYVHIPNTLFILHKKINCILLNDKKGSICKITNPHKLSVNQLRKEFISYTAIEKKERDQQKIKDLATPRRIYGNSTKSNHSTMYLSFESAITEKSIDIVKLIIKWNTSTFFIRFLLIAHRERFQRFIGLTKARPKMVSNIHDSAFYKACQI